jgi:3-hydroxymyristoyl/3-hydroxydecanoyl-(acyl carrier protein) dehydratase
MPGERRTVRYTVDPAHPALPGHFPGNPVVPAVLLVRFVAQTVESLGRTLSALDRMKFVRPVRPGEAVDVTVTWLSDEQGSVEIEVNGIPVAKGLWRSTRT